VGYPNQRKRLEKRYGQPIEQLLPRLANQYGSLDAVAEHLGYSRQTLWKWAREIGMERQFVVPNSTKRG